MNPTTVGVLIGLAVGTFGGALPWYLLGFRHGSHPAVAKEVAATMAKRLEDLRERDARRRYTHEVDPRRFVDYANVGGN